MSKHIATVLTTAFAMAVLMSASVLLPSTAKAQHARACQDFTAQGSGANREETLRNTNAAYQQLAAQIKQSRPRARWTDKLLQTTCNHDFRSCNITFRLCTLQQPKSTPSNSSCTEYVESESGPNHEVATWQALAKLREEVIYAARKTAEAYGWSEEETKRRFTVVGKPRTVCLPPGLNLVDYQCTVSIQACAQ